MIFLLIPLSYSSKGQASASSSGRFSRLQAFSAWLKLTRSYADQICLLSIACLHTTLLAVERRLIYSILVDYLLYSTDMPALT